MGTLGPNSPLTFADDSTVGTIAIANPSNAGASDDVYATIVMLLAQVGHYLKATNFQFAIPGDASIDGILVEIERSATVGVAIVDSSVKIVKGGTIGGTEKASGSSWPTSDAYASYGSATDLWGQTWTPADINLSTFGVAIAATASLIAGTARIDHVRITVSYTGSNRGQAMASNRRINAGGMGQSEFVS